MQLTSNTAPFYVRRNRSYIFTLACRYTKTMHRTLNYALYIIHLRTVTLHYALGKYATVPCTIALCTLHLALSTTHL